MERVRDQLHRQAGRCTRVRPDRRSYRAAEGARGGDTALIGATTAIGLLPTQAQIGVAAPIVLILARLLQGIAVGGEFGGAATYVAEYAPKGRRGYDLSWLGVAVGGGLLAGSFGALLVTNTASPEVVNGWLWRIPFLLALPLGLVGVYVRTQLTETPEFLAAAAASEGSARRARNASQQMGRDMPRVLYAAGVLSAMTAATYIFLIFLPSYLSTAMDFAKSDATVINTTAVVTFCVALPFFGKLSDRIGAPRLILISTVLLLLLSYPAMNVLDSGNVSAGIIAMVVMGIVSAMGFASGLAAIPELFSVHSRYTSLGLGWNIAAVVFGGTGPLIITEMTSLTGSILTPAYFVMAGAVCTLVALQFRNRLAG
ncbi:MFS transporter [Tsukamurella sp. PLM1]|uniref:MFS transporter n=1 Tax=Tsukamurella sp. PLM1 TaxID=2929795 RepID=UPI0020C149E7|nr:MFS transporter [Tsukamurella sp. PLM1]